MSHQAVTWAYSQDITPAGAKFVLVTLANYANPDGYCYPSQEALAADTGQSVRAVRRQIEALEAMGIVCRERRHAKSGHRKSDGFWLVGFKELPADVAASQPAKPSASQPDNLAAGLPDTLAETTGHIEHSLPDNLAGLYIEGTVTLEPSEEPSERTNGVHATPWMIVAAFYDELQRDISAAPKRWRKAQCGMAETLIADGCTEMQVRRLARFMATETWRDGELTLKAAVGAYGDWFVAGMPERAKGRASPPRRLREPDTTGVDEFNAAMDEAEELWNVQPLRRA